MSPTEVQIQSHEGVNESVQKTQSPGAPYQTPTQLFTHQLAIDQRVTDGSIAVISHGREHKNFSSCNGEHKKKPEQGILLLVLILSEIGGFPASWAQ